MKTFSFYHKKSGDVHPQRFMTTNDEPGVLERNTPADHVPIEGELSHLCHYVDPHTRTVGEFTPDPPSDEHLWNAADRRFDLKPEVLAKQRARQAALAQIWALEAHQHRAVREFLLGHGGADRLAEIDSQISALRSALT